eukprot:3951093-Prymnesium_polylepis.1
MPPRSGRERRARALSVHQKVPVAPPHVRYPSLMSNEVAFSMPDGPVSWNNQLAALTRKCLTAARVLRGATPRDFAHMKGHR